MRKLPIAIVCFSILGCAVQPGGSGSGSFGPGGKADDYYSPTSLEYVVEGRTTVTLEASYADATFEEQEVRVRELIGLKHFAMSYFLTQYLTEKYRRDPGAGWGGFGGMARAGSYRDMNIEYVNGLTWEFTFQQIIASSDRLLNLLPLGEGGLASDEFLITVGRPSNEELAELETDHEWFRRAPWKAWNPARVNDASLKENMVLRIWREEASADAWFDYEELFEDDRLTIDVHFGYDYHSQYHRKHARSLYLWLKNEMGFDAPISAFRSLTRESGAFVRTLNANGREIRVEVRIFYGKDGGANDPNTDEGGRLLEEDIRRSFASADVVVFAGHAGAYYGFSMANWKRTPEGDISYHELETLEMRDGYQIIVADGCDTYQTAQAFARNPAHLGGDRLDVVTTANSGDAEQPYSVMNAILHLMEAGPDGEHRPRSIRSFLVDLTLANQGNPLYGIHFIDDNPTLHPYADVEWSCEPCESHSHCGALGNRCARFPGENIGFCAAACTADDQCPNGYECGQIADASAHAIYERGCVPETLECYP